MYGEGQRCLRTLPCPSLCRRLHSIVAAPCFLVVYRAGAPLNFSVAALTVSTESKTLTASPPRRLEAAVIAEPDNPPRRKSKGPDSGMIRGSSGRGEATDILLRRFMLDVFAPTLAVPGVRTSANVFHRAPRVLSA